MKGTLTHIAARFKSIINAEGFEDLVSHFILSVKQQLLGALDEADYEARQALFQYYLNTNEFKEAASILAGINFESTTFIISNTEKANIYIKCAGMYLHHFHRKTTMMIVECSLEDDESVDAEVFVNRAGPFMIDITDRFIQLRYRATAARVLDANRKFLDASLRYYDLSNANDVDVCS